MESFSTHAALSFESQQVILNPSRHSITRPQSSQIQTWTRSPNSQRSIGIRVEPASNGRNQIGSLHA